jgi:hypothetical protein
MGMFSNMVSKCGGVAVMLTVLLTANCSRLDALDDARSFADVAVDASRVRTRVIGDPLLGRDGLPGTAFEAIPSSGEATFKGAVILAATDASDDDAGFALVGRSDVTVDFGATGNSIRGTLDDFQSSRAGDGILDVSGQLSLNSGEVGATRPNQFTVDYAGDVTVEGKSYAMSGDMLGQFRGTRTDPSAGQSTVRALSAIDLNGTVRGNGERLVGRMTIIAEN